MTRRITILIFLLTASLFGLLSAQAQTARMTGVIIDANNEEPLVGANFYIEQLKNGKVAGRNGEFSIGGLDAGTYTATVSYIGYHKQSLTISLRAGETRKLTIRLKPQSQSLDEVIVMGKSEARKIREQAMPVTVLSAAQLAGSVSDVSDILSKTMGVTIRSQGGVGSASRLSVRGLEGKRIGFFIDEAPMNEHSDFIDINDIPVSMIERIEIYKGVVPAKFGGSAMGGAVNVVLKEYPPRYLDVSYAVESFNTHKATAVVKRNLPNAGIELGGGGFYTYSDNDYTMESPYHQGLTIKRDHDRFEAMAGALGMKARKWYFDELEITLEGVKNSKQIQGIFSNIRHAHSKSMAGVLETELKKKDFLTEGLDLNFSGAAAITRFNYIDTAMHRYNWQMEPYNPVHPLGGETGTAPSNSTIHKTHIATKLNLNYILSPQHALNLHTSQVYAHGNPKDELKDRALGYKTNYDSDMNSLVAGLSYDYKSPGDRLLNSLTGKYYFYSMKTTLRKLMAGNQEEPIDFEKHYWGISDALRYRFSKELMGKISAAYEVRTPMESELIGDGYLIAPASDLLPERGGNVNIGALWDKKIPHGIFQLEVNLFGSYLQDMIRQTRNIYQTQYENFGEMRSLGVEAEVKADMLSWLYGYANVTFQDLRDTRKYEYRSQVPNPTYQLRMPNIPYLMANGGVELHKENFLGVRNTNARFFADAAFVEQYFYDFEQSMYQERRIPRSLRLDLGIEYTMLGGALILSAKMGNATNAKLFSEFNYPLPGRTFSVRLRYVLK
ncbi:TonB-dependent receptor [Bacteroides heparinolyticus]|uniref:TonB-dependent receptor n=1 Tax=Prevotella heparinolytica TaxID=28113 RepID=A0A3P2A8H1_9BACE|nr:TonB-dependent receptor [Bacteroides heparinolyticus]RRD91106.1 TonB-dependent receptor [Bacteroides heparinolyticus]